VIVNASLAGMAPDSACNELQEFSQRCFFALEWAPEDVPGQAASLQKKNSHVELLRDCECVPAGVAPDSASPSCRIFERRCFALS
jgi:hypothetical protein